MTNKKQKKKTDKSCNSSFWFQINQVNKKYTRLPLKIQKINRNKS